MKNKQNTSNLNNNTNINQNFLSQNILKAYEHKDIAGLKKLLKSKRIDKIVESLEAIDDTQIILFVLVATKDGICGEIFKYLNTELKSKIIDDASLQQLRIILFELYNDDVTILKNDFPMHTKKILLSLDSQQRAAIKQLSEFDEDEAGSIVNSDFFTINQSISVKEALIEIKRMYNDFEQSNIIYVVDDYNRLKGYVTIHSLLFADSFDLKISSVVQEDVFYVRSDEDIDAVLDIFRKYQIEQLAVVDKNDQLIGYISDNDILPVINTETTTDIYKMYGISELDFPYIKSSVFVLFKSRLLWLAVLMISATCTGFLIDKFQNVGQLVTAGLSTLVIVPIIPAMTGTSGNAGSQAAASVIRALSIGEITTKEYNKVLAKEFLVGALIGLVLAVINFARLIIYFAIIKPDLQQYNVLYNNITNNPHSQMIVGAIVSAGSSVALFFAIVISKLLGGILPLLATKLKIDPTIMSTPILSTLLDMVTTIILFGFGILFLLIIVDKVKVEELNNMRESIHAVKNINSLLPKQNFLLNNSNYLNHLA
ncbi:magnesium transporter [Ureaplasma urealyticum]|uniref:Magnesium transporter MgtE n=2 Tax=Ureaplasma urealyticum TaxID=2130 RepID=A0AAP9D732_UREUR|nr:magnesium transporter [Ureaplasma urealyticum]EDX54191.1 magnesium transporter [Ureaplasma urealyticum serovar 9 str. ATCC 33175]EDT49511.1 magnesium transporter [Ureaplasma urealyticum serovar 13 str. ATCC 33698]EDU06519.1 magnesium transporter [Ureaplasma urealyticum serovar 5 str. ATCC 27817]EDU56678.1 magnesium transporter [Ureaplasma urealyticum serovar 7 str. ATCC 27819]EDU67376.1 magnesium transporter [Ureaplasma urealyticum serovar 11 str. ATCC 33695]